MTRKNLDAETPTKNFCNQIRKSKQKAKLTCLLQERPLTPEETLKDPTQKQYEEIFSQTKIKNHVKEFYSSLYAKKPTNPDREEIIHAIGKDNFKTLNPLDLKLTEREISMCELEHCRKKTRNNIASGSSRFTGAFHEAFWSTLKYLVHSTIDAIFIKNELPESLRLE